MNCLSKRHRAVEILTRLICWFSITYLYFGILYATMACCTAYSMFETSNCADHNCEGAVIFAAPGPNGGHGIYAPYGVCSNMDIVRNISDCWLTNYRGCDFNSDGIVNFVDYAVMLNLWSER